MDREERVALFLGSGASIAMLIAVVALAVWARRQEGRQWLAIGRPSRTASVAAFGSAVVSLLLVGVAGGAVASLFAPRRPPDPRDPFQQQNSRLFLVLAVVVAVGPFLVWLASVFWRFAQRPPRELGAGAVALLHGLLAALMAGVGLQAESARAVLGSLAAASAPGVAAVAYGVLFARAVRREVR